jgi:hypothetical protein
LAGTAKQNYDPKLTHKVCQMATPPPSLGGAPSNYQSRTHAGLALQIILQKNTKTSREQHLNFPFGQSVGETLDQSGALLLTLSLGLTA